MPHDVPDPTDSPPPVASSKTSPAVAGRPGRVPVRALALWLLGLFITVALAAIAAWGGVLLAVFGFSGVSLVVGVVMLAVAATVWRRALLPAAVIVCALTLATASQALQVVRYKPQFGTYIAAPRTPADVPRAGYHHGVGPTLVDLRQFHAPSGSTTTIAARADQGELVVALPRGRCFHLEVTGSASYVPQGGLADEALRLAGLHGIDSTTSYSDMGLTNAAFERRAGDGANSTQPSSRSWFPLLAYGVQPPMRDGRWTRRAVGVPGAPTLRLHLVATQQIVVRDYPDWVGPLDGTVEYQQQDGLAWPSAVAAPLSPGQRRWAGRAWVRTTANRTAWVAWERQMLAWAKAQAARFAGACASQEALRDRGYSFITQPATVRDRAGHARTLLGQGADRRSPIPQRAVSANQALLVEVDGLGHVRSKPIAGIVTTTNGVIS